MNICIIKILSIAFIAIGMSQAMVVSFSGGADGTLYNEAGEFDLGTDGSMKMSSVFSTSVPGGMASSTSYHFDGTDNVMRLNQNMNCEGEAAQPSMFNEMVIHGGKADVSMFMGYNSASAEMGISSLANSTSQFDIYIGSTYENYRPINVETTGLHGTIKVFDRFNFNRETQTSSAVFTINRLDETGGV